MDQDIDRRDFAKRSSLAVGGLLAGSLLGTGHVAGQDRDRSDRDNAGNDISGMRLVLLGLNGLARSPEMDYFKDGHRGASMVAAHIECANNKLDEPTTSRIVELFDLNWASSKLCKPFPQEDPKPDRIGEIGAALAKESGVLRQVGHDAIFAMLAIQAFRMLPTAATPKRIDGVCRLIASFTPWRDVKPDPKVDPPPFKDTVATSKYVLAEASAALDRWIGFGQGYAGHMLTFGHAIVELAVMGDVEWAESCRTAFRKYVTVTRQGPDPDGKRYTEHKPTDLRPSDGEYWQKRGKNTLGLGHVFKYTCSYYELLRRAADPKLRESIDAKAYRLF